MQWDQRCIWIRELRFETSALTSHGALGNLWSQARLSSEQQQDLWIQTDSSVAFGKVHSLHSWGKLLRFLIICCRHLKPDLCSALSSYLPAYLPGTVKCLRIRLSAAMAAALLTGEAGACPCRLLVPRSGREGGSPECPRCSARRFAALHRRGARIPREAPGPPHPLAAGLDLYFRMKRSKRNSGSAFNISPNPFFELEWFSHPCYHQQQQIPHNDASFIKQLVN